VAGGALRELVAFLGIEVDDKQLAHADKEIEGFAEKLEALGPTLAKVGKLVGEAFGAEKFAEFVKEGIEAATHVQNLANRLDVSASTLQQFGDVAQGAGVDLDSAAQSLGLFQKNLGAAASKGGETAAAFARLGIDAKEAANTPLPELLGQVSEGLANLPDQNQKAAAAMAIFGRSGRELLPILGQGKEALEEAFGEVQALGNGLGDKFYADSKRAAEAWEHFTIGVRSLKERALDAILPAIEILGRFLTKLVEGALELDKRTHILSTTMVVIAGIIGVALVDALITAAAAAWAFAAPFLATWGPIIALVAGLVWIIQDLWNLMTGGPSIIGDIIEKFGGLGAKKQVIDSLKEAWDGIVGVLADVAYDVGYLIGILIGLGKVVGGLDIVTGFFSGLLTGVLALSRAVLGFVQTLLAIPKAIAAGSFDPITKAIDKTGEAIFGQKGLLGGLGAGQASSDVTKYGVPSDAVALWNAHHPEGGAGAPSAAITRTKATALLGAGEGGGGFNNGNGGASVEQHNQTHVVVHTASDQPKAVGDAVGAGVATSHEKNMNEALASVTSP